MNNLKIVMTLLVFIISNGIIAQQQELVTIEMFQYNEHNSATPGGGGVSAFEIFPFVIKTTNGNNEISYKTFEQRKRSERIETFPLLRQEIVFWLSKGYELFSFNVTGTGDDRNRYIVILTKEI
jgi:hypothetical protein